MSRSVCSALFRVLLAALLLATLILAPRSYALAAPTISGPSSFQVQAQFSIDVGTLFPNKVEVYSGNILLGNATQQTTSTWVFTWKPRVWLGYTNQCPDANGICSHPSDFLTHQISARAYTGNNVYFTNTITTTQTAWAAKPISDTEVYNTTTYHSKIATYFDTDPTSGVQKDYSTPKTGWVGYLAAGNYLSADPHAYDDHRGIDIALSLGFDGNPNNIPIQNVFPGQVTAYMSDYMYKDNSGCGNYVLVDHSSYFTGEGLPSHYTQHCHARTGSVRGAGTYVGKTVWTGDTLGIVGCTGTCGGDHDHFAIMVGGSTRDFAIDPYTQGYMSFLYCDHQVVNSGC